MFKFCGLRLLSWKRKALLFFISNLTRSKNKQKNVDETSLSTYFLNYSIETCWIVVFFLIG